MNSRHWTTLGTLFLMLSCLAPLAFAKATLELKNVMSSSPVAAAETLEEGNFTSSELFSRRDLKANAGSNALSPSERGRPHRPTVAMHPGIRARLVPDSAYGTVYVTADASPQIEKHVDASRSVGVEGAAFEWDGLVGDASAVLDGGDKTNDEPEAWDEEEDQEIIDDPLEPLNRAFFKFNDKLYFWVLKPAARGYSFVVPEAVRMSVRNVFSNLAMPVRAVNCLLQGKFKSFGEEILRFFVNSTAGFLGMADVAASSMKLEGQDEDFGQTIGFFGAGPGPFINWPLFGPSNVRDTFGMAGDWFLDPLNYLVPKRWENVAVKGGDKVNRTSLTLGDYESLKKSALDPYAAVRDAYFQYRKNKIKK